MRVGRAFDEAFEHDGIVGGAHRVGAVGQHNLELARCIFRNQGASGQAHFFRAGKDVIKEGRKVFQILHETGLKMLRRIAIGRLRRLCLAAAQDVAVDEIKFKLDGDDGRQAA